jgi:hypothetical protein
MYFQDKFALQFISMLSDFDLRKPIDRILGFLNAHLSESLGERGHDRVFKVPMNTTQVRSVQKVVKVAYKISACMKYTYCFTCSLLALADTDAKLPAILLEDFSFPQLVLKPTNTTCMSTKKLET